jgi:hypothetical protein
MQYFSVGCVVRMDVQPVDREVAINIRMTSEDKLPERLVERRLCFRCIGEEFLRNLVKRKGQRANCSYCGLQRRTFSISQLAELIESVMNEHYQRTPEEPSAYEYALQRDGLGDWFREGEPVAEVIESLAEIDRRIAEDIRRVLYRRHFDRERMEMGEEGPFDEDMGSIELHVIKGIQVATDRHRVGRHRTDRTALMPHRY